MVKRRSSFVQPGRIDHLFRTPTGRGEVFLHYGDMTDAPT